MFSPRFSRCLLIPWVLGTLAVAALAVGWLTSEPDDIPRAPVPPFLPNVEIRASVPPSYTPNPIYLVPRTAAPSSSATKLRGS